MRATWQQVKLFKESANGSISILFGVMCVCLMLTAGIAIDSARFQNLATRIQDAADAAALSGAKLLADENASDQDIKDMTRRHFNQSISNTGVKIARVAPLRVTIDRANASIEARSVVRVRSFFGKLANMPALNRIERVSKVVYDMQRIELSMVLDITGSMNDNNKISGMKSAAKDVIDELLKNSLTEDGVRIALAPYSASVNAGAMAGMVQSPPVLPAVINDTCVIERQGLNAATDAAPSGADKLPNVPSLPYGNYNCPDATVLALQGRSNRDLLKNTIDSYVASGATAGHIGTAWGWYLLSPNWSGILPAASDPKPYGESGVSKSMIVMTDGLFNTSYLTGGSTPYATQTEESYAQFQALCSGAKAKDITIYTVGFDLSNARAVSELQSCASGGSNFFDAKTGADLKKAFKSIADKLNQLRVAS
jgi:Flp pilus assembly protein TadG